MSWASIRRRPLKPYLGRANSRFSLQCHRLQRWEWLLAWPLEWPVCSADSFHPSSPRTTRKPCPCISTRWFRELESLEQSLQSRTKACHWELGFRWGRSAPCSLALCLLWSWPQPWAPMAAPPLQTLCRCWPRHGHESPEVGEVW